MFDFDIEFLTSTTFKITDNSDYTGLTVTNTDLNIYLPTITEGVFETITLALVGGEQTIDTSLLDPSFSLIDGVYKFDFIVTSDENGVETTSKYIIKDLDLVICRRLLLRNLITSVDECKACEANSFDSTLNSAKKEAELGLFKEAQLLIAYLINVCNDCDC